MFEWPWRDDESEVSLYQPDKYQSKLFFEGQDSKTKEVGEIRYHEFEWDGLKNHREIGGNLPWTQQHLLK